MYLYKVSAFLDNTMDRINKESQTYFHTTRMLNFTEIYSLHSLFTQRVCHIDAARLFRP